MKSKRISWSKFAAVEDSCPTKRKCIANHKHPTTNYELDEIMRWDEASLWYPRHLLEISARTCLDVTCTLVFRNMEGGHVTPLQRTPPASCSNSMLQWAWLLAAGFSMRHHVISDAENSAQLKQFGAQTALSSDFLLPSETPKIDASSRHKETPKFNLKKASRSARMDI